jgi:hypothetical protein
MVTALSLFFREASLLHDDYERITGEKLKDNVPLSSKNKAFKGHHIIYNNIMKSFRILSSSL